MTKVWLILIDILVAFFLILSFILFYLNVTQKEIIVPPKDQNITIGPLSLPELDLNDTITLDDLIRTGEQSDTEEEYFTESIIKTRTLKEGLVALSAKVGDPVFIRIFKDESLLEVWIHTGTVYEHLKDYAICAYSGHLGPKLKEGDKQAPEGFYRVEKYQLNPKSKFHLSFNLGYPNAYDRARKRTGSFLMVHGNCVSIGCYAMTDEKIEEIYALVESALDNGQKQVQVHAYPFMMTDENMAFYEGNEWYDFWANLKEGYDYFETEKLPPHIKVKNRRYEVHEAKE